MSGCVFKQIVAEDRDLTQEHPGALSGVNFPGLLYLCNVR